MNFVVAFGFILGAVSARKLNGRGSKIDTIVAFGNSLTDNGVDATIGDRHGFVKYANGPTWPDYLTKRIGSDQNHPEVKNWAYSGGLSGYGNYYFQGWSGVLWQIEKFLQENPVIPSTTLVVLEIGGTNDLYDGKDNVDDVIKNALDGIRRLLNAGANVIAWDLMEFTTAPYFRGETASKLVPSINDMIRKVNNGIRDGLNNESLLEPGSGLILVDSSKAINWMKDRFRIQDRPFTHHRNNTEQDEIFEYAWYDDYHPSTGTHQLISDLIYEDGVMMMRDREGSNDNTKEKNGPTEIFQELVSSLVDGFNAIRKAINEDSK